MRLRTIRHIVVVLLLLSAGALQAQRERQIAPPPDDGQFGSKFFDQLRSIFGRFRDSDLSRVFQLADPIQCNELIAGKGEWRTVAFFNEKRELGDWYRSNIEEVRTDLAVYLFKGPCRGDRGSVQLTTKFPVGDSVDDYNDGKIPFSQIDINVNAPVTASFDTKSNAYLFDLPYLYLIQRNGNNAVYSLTPQHFGDKYATDVTNPWECKAVSSIDITYRFMICRTTTSDRRAGSNTVQRGNNFGSRAFFILSDGSEAKTSITLNFGDGVSPPPPIPDNPPAAAKPGDSREPVGTVGWQAPPYRASILKAGDSDFRVLFNSQAWKTRITSPQVISNQRIENLAGARPPEGADYCVWTPGVANLLDRLLDDEPDKSVSYSMTGVDRAAQTTASITIVMKALTGARLGALQCFFLRTEAADAVGYDRWSAIAGSQLKFEVRP